VTVPVVLTLRNWAIALNPSAVNSHHGSSHLLPALGRTADSFAESRRVLDIDPLDPAMNAHMGWHYVMGRRFEKAILHEDRELFTTLFRLKPQTRSERGPGLFCRPSPITLAWFTEPKLVQVTG
jgi:hypothetical protein